VETVGYISSGYKNWMDVAIQRSTAGLLHGFGAAMVAVGVYYLSHKNSLVKRRILVGISCILYAILQHAIWNGTFLVAYLPAPLGPYLAGGMVVLGPIVFDAILLVYIVESLLMGTFLMFVTWKISGSPAFLYWINFFKKSSKSRTPNLPHEQHQILTSNQGSKNS
jgi:hypothetical protein